MEKRLKIPILVQVIVISAATFLLPAHAAGLAGELAPLQVADLDHAKLAVENLSRLAAAQTGAARVQTQRLATVVKNLFTAEYQVAEALKAGRKSEVEAVAQERMSQEWMRPNAFGRVNADGARGSLEKAAALRALAAQQMAEAQQQLLSQLQEADSVVQDFYKLQEFGVVLVLAETAATVEERALAAGLPKSFARESVAKLRLAIQQRRTAIAEQALKSGEPTLAEIDLAASLGRDIAAIWNDAAVGPKGLPPRLGGALAARLVKLLPHPQPDPAMLAKSRFPGLQLAYATDQALGAEPPNLHAIAAWCAAGQRLKPQEVPWLGAFTRMLETRRGQALAAQQQAMKLLQNGDPQTAESRLSQAAREFSSPGLAAHAAGLVLFNKLCRDPALLAVESDWKKPSAPDPALLKQAAALAVTLRAAAGAEILPAWAQLAGGLEAACLLGCFWRECVPAGAADPPHPLRAMQVVRKTGNYAALQASDSPFVKPFRAQLQTLEQRLGPKLAEYEKLLEQARGLEKKAMYPEAAAKYQLALILEPSKDLEQTLDDCEAKISGL